MDSLIKRIKAGSDNIKLLDYPGTDTKVGLRVLSVNELQSAVIDTDRFFGDKKISVSIQTGSIAMVDEFEAERITQILYRALRDPEDLSKPIASNITEFRSNISNLERDALGKEYVAFEKECSPAPENSTNEELEAMYQDIKKNYQQAIGNVSSISTAKKLMLCLVRQLENLQKDSGSTSSLSAK
jgi:glycosylphosphatidylinositol transamidase (GPIT) subunit GPI8